MTKEEEFGAQLRRLRLERNLSLRAAAQMAGISHMRLDELERGKSRSTGRPTRARRESVAAIANAYGVPRDALLEMAGYAREQSDLTAPEQLMIATMRRLDHHHLDLALQIVTLLDRVGRPPKS